MIQFNLLPDIKIEYLKARRQKRLVVLGSVIAIVASLSIFLVLVVVVHGIQKKSLSDLNGDIKTSSNELEDTKDLTKILTVQNQIEALPGLHDKKAVASRLFSYMSQMTPAQASITKLAVDFAQSTITISGVSDKLTTVNTYADTLKFTKYQTEGSGARSAFSNVVLESFGRDSKAATFTISAKFEPAIFSATQEVELAVPNIISTRSEVEQPSALFQKPETIGGSQ